MASFNKVLLMGNVTRDPELRYTPSGAAVCALGFAVNRRFTNTRGEEQNETCFVDVDVWGKQAENVSRYLRKGSPAFIEGRLRYDQWDDRETGKKRSRLTVTAERVQFLSSGPGRSAEFSEPAEEFVEPAADNRGATRHGGDTPAVRAASPPPPPFPTDSGTTEDAAGKPDETIDDIPF